LEVFFLIDEGDFTYYGTDEDFDKFIDFLDALKGWKHKIVISGNHEIVLDAGLNS
jgi:3',5'-cyclic AMP phosphodiesterase CpdA